MLNKINSRAFIISAVLIVLVNIAIFIHVANNKSESTGRLTLTEREVSLSANQSFENSGLALSLEFRALSPVENYYSGYRSLASPKWLDREKMASLGFSVDRELKSNDTINRQTEKKEVFVALEFNSNSYETMLKRVERWHAKESENPESEYSQERLDTRLEIEKKQASRLFVIDAVIEKEQLISKYKDKQNIVFAKAIVGVHRRAFDAEYNNKNKNKGIGYIQRLSINKINVPYPFNFELKGLPRSNYDHIQDPRYSVELDIGRALEPSIVNVSIFEN